MKNPDRLVPDLLHTPVPKENCRNAGNGRGLFIWLLLLFTGIGCAFASAEERLRLATTTSVQNSGLMPYLLPHFEEKHNCKVYVIAVGTGQALKIASNGDVDMVLVHAPGLEKRFLDDGFGLNRKTFMVNDFVILGPFLLLDEPTNSLDDDFRPILLELLRKANRDRGATIVLAAHDVSFTSAIAD